MPEIIAHAKLERTTYHVYILKLVDGGFYVGQTNNLKIRMLEHRDGLQSHTKGKDPKLVYFEQFEGDRDGVSERENELTKLNQSPKGRRRLREMIENFRGPLRLLDLDA
ncbi:MAG: GIY-YIG nuclease family protein [Dehalococcoidia bacterium]